MLVFHSAVSFAAAEGSRHPPVFVFTSGCCGGPEWVERTVSKSKPIRTHFCCPPTPSSHPAPPHPVASPRTDDVTDCCEHCFHGNAHHRFGLHFRQLSLPPFSNPPPPLSLSISLSLSLPSLPPSLLTTRLTRRRVSDIRGGGWRKLTAADRKKKRTFTGEQKAG